MSDQNTAAKAAAVLVRVTAVSAKAAADKVAGMAEEYVVALAHAYDTNNGQLVRMVLDEEQTAEQLAEMKAARVATMQADASNS